VSVRACAGGKGKAGQVRVSLWGKAAQVGLGHVQVAKARQGRQSSAGRVSACAGGKGKGKGRAGKAGQVGLACVQVAKAGQG